MAFDIDLSYNVLTQLSRTEISNIVINHMLSWINTFLEFHTQTYYTSASNITPHHIIKTQFPT
jgi:hypothetical protein